MKRIVILATTLSLMIISGCSSSPKAPESVMAAPKTVMSNVPDWYITPPPSPAGYVLAAGTGISRDLSMSVAKARLDAEIKIAQHVNAEVSTMMKDYRRDSGDNFSQVTEIVTNKLAARVKVNAKVEKSVVIEEGGGFRSYVLLQSSDVNVTSLQEAKDAAERELSMRTN